MALFMMPKFGMTMEESTISRWPKAPGLGNRDVLRETVDEARKHDLPAIVYCVLQYPNQDPGNRTLQVHLIAYNSPPQTTPVRERPYVLPGLIEDAPMYRAAIATAGALEGAEAWNRSTRIERGGNRGELTIDDIHEILVLRGDLR